MRKRKQIGIRRLKNEASRVLSEVREREQEYVVTKRGKPVAVLRPIGDAELHEDQAADIAALIARLRRSANEVAAVSAGGSAAATVSRQRR